MSTSNLIRRLVFFLCVWFMAAFAACQYSSTGSWNGWIAFYSQASFKGTVCGYGSVDYVVGKLGSDDGLATRALYSAYGSAWEELKEQVACINKAKNCDQFWRCRWPKNSQPCDPATFDATCEGDTAINCSYRETHSDNEYFISRIDCSEAPGGGSCTLDDTGTDCMYNQCLPEATNPRCDGNLALACEPHDYSYIYWRMDCSILDMQCLQGGYCGIPGAINCDGNDREICDGPYIHGCHPGPDSQDCRELDPDFLCFKDEYGQARCGMPEGSWECEENGQTWCVGSVLKACVYGKIVSFDCSSISGSRCESDHCSMLAG